MNPFRYRSYLYDQETGLCFLKTRYYDPTVGRFINADEVSYINPETINGLNLYAYCGNNPVVRIDPTGCGWFNNLVTAVAVVAVAAIVITSVVLTAGAAVAAVATAYVSSSTAVAIGTAVTVGAYGVAAGIGICAASDVGEIYTGTNVVRDYAMGGNQELYDFTRIGLSMGAAGIVDIGILNPSPPKTTYYRGGNDMQARSIDVKIKDGLVQPGKQGLSVNTNPSAVAKFGTPYKITSIPNGLSVVQQGRDLGHHVISPSSPMTLSNFQSLLDQIRLKKG